MALIVQIRAGIYLSIFPHTLMVSSSDVCVSGAVEVSLPCHSKTINKYNVVPLISNPISMH